MTDIMDATDSGPLLDMIEDDLDLSLPMKKKKKKKVKLELAEDAEEMAETGEGD